MYDYSYDYYYSDPYAYEAVGGVLAIVAVIWLIMAAVLIFSLACQWKLFKKAGKPGWYAIIPFLNTWTM